MQLLFIYVNIIVCIYNHMGVLNFFRVGMCSPDFWAWGLGIDFAVKIHMNWFLSQIMVFGIEI